MGRELEKLWTTEDYWAVKPGSWSTADALGADFSRHLSHFLTVFADLFTFGLKPFWAFTIGVAVNVPFGYFLSTVVFSPGSGRTSAR